MAYAVQHPLTFITGVSGSENDWLWSAHSDDLWSASKKSAYDPCPYGWRVAPSAVFDGLKLVGAPTAADADQNHIVNALVLFSYLVSNAHERAVERGLVHYLSFELHLRSLRATKNLAGRTGKTHKYAGAQHACTI